MTVVNTDKMSLQSAIQSHVVHGTSVFTDGHDSYRGLEDCKHQPVDYSAKEFVNGIVHTNDIESVGAVLKRGHNCVYHNWSKEYTCQYVNEFSFRPNEDDCKVDTQDGLDACLALCLVKVIYKVD